MKRAFALLFAVLLGACASTNSPQSLGGRYALRVRPVRSSDSLLSDWAAIVADDLRGRGAQVDIVDDAAAAASYDAVIVLSSIPSGARGQVTADLRSPFVADPGEPDAAGTQVQPSHLGKLTYEIRRGNATVAKGSSNLTTTNDFQPAGGQSGFTAQAAHTLAASIARKLSRG